MHIGAKGRRVPTSGLQFRVYRGVVIVEDLHPMSIGIAQIDEQDSRRTMAPGPALNAVSITITAGKVAHGEDVAAFRNRISKMMQLRADARHQRQVEADTFAIQEVRNESVA